MRTDTLEQLAKQLRVINSLYVEHVGTGKESEVCEEAAEWLELIAPLAPVITPMLAGRIRQKIERTEATRLRREVEELRHLIAQLRHPSGPSLMAEIHADRLVREARNV